MNKLTVALEQYFSALRERALSASEKNSDVMNADPRFVTNSREILSCRAQLYQTKNDSFSRSAAEQRLQSLVKRREQILAEHGLTEELLKPRFQCKQCNDSGFLSNGYACDCYKKAYSRLLLEEWNIPTVEYESFTDCNPSLFPSVNYSKFYQFCKNYDSAPTRTFTFAGSAGTGKTFLMHCMCNEFVKAGKNVICLSSFSVNEIFRRSVLDNDMSGFYMLVNCDVLGVDDLGTEPLLNNITKEMYFRLLDERQLKNRLTVFTTNNSQDVLAEKYSERFISRLLERQKSRFVTFSSDDVRLKKR